MDNREAIQMLAALAQEHRLAIFRRLMREGPSGMAASVVADAVGISRTSLSFHLKELDRAGVVTSWRDGRFVRYAVSIKGMRRLLTFLTEECCQGDPRICGELGCVEDVSCPEDVETAHE